MNSGPDADAPPPLQFDTAVPSVPVETTSATPGVNCVSCQQLVVEEYFDINGHAVCMRCRDLVSQQAQTPTGAGPLLRAGALGVVAAILGATLYFAVIAITGFEIGLVAIAIGYMVGYGIRFGTRGRGGRRFQVLAIVLTYWSVGLSYTPLVLRQAAEQKSEQTTELAAPADGAGTTDAAATADAGDLSLAYVVAVLLGISFALPVLSIASSLPGGLISAAIIAFGMHQAWRMTAAPQLAISGPYRVGVAPPAVS